MVGKILGNRYRILREVGSGGMAWVYLAEDINESRLVAVKVLYPQFGEDLSYIHRFNREAKLASAMTDSHIVRVLDYGADRDVYYLVMEYIEGRDLREVLAEKGRYHWREALEILDQLATALDHAHQHEVVHRDIKPQNMMLDDNGLLKVLDFGIARISTLPSLTQSGFIGSPYYVSPEQAMSEEVDIRSDIYSAGIVFFEMLSGNIPFDAKSPWSIISQHIANDLPPIELGEDEEEIPENVHQLLNRMVAKQREERFQTPAGLRRAISAVLAGQPLPKEILDTRPISSPDQLDLAESLFARAMEAVEAEEWTRAADLLNQTLKINPNHKEAQVHLEKAEHESFLIASYNTAIRAMDRKAWRESIEKFTALLEENPEFKDAPDLLEKSREAFSQEKDQQTITERYVEGISHFESERWDEAVIAFREVQNLSPGYQRTEEYLADAEKKAKPSLLQSVGNLFSLDLGRWGLIAIGLLAIVFTFAYLGNGNFATGDNDNQEQLKALYNEAQDAVTAGNTDQAIALLDEILAQDPNYADAAEQRRDLITELTPEPEALPTPLPELEENSLTAKIGEVEDALELGVWADAIDILMDIRTEDPNYEEARVSSLFCDAYIGQGLEMIGGLRDANVDEVNIMNTALTAFEAGVTECPRRLDLQDQADRATNYLNVLALPADDVEAQIRGLTPLVAADLDYAEGNAKRSLYQAYLDRASARVADDDIVGALGDYDAALALNVANPSEAQTKRAELILGLQQPAQTQPETPVEPVATSETANNEPDEETTPTTEPAVVVTLGKPVLIEPIDDTKFGGDLADVILRWEPTPNLAPDEYYDLTVMHIFADQPRYWGIATTESEFKLPPEIGVGEAGNDRFYWWVTVRKNGTAPAEGELDLARSPQSDTQSFIWAP